MASGIGRMMGTTARHGSQPFRLDIDLRELYFNQSFLPEELLKPGAFLPYVSAIVNDEATTRASQQNVIRGVNLFGAAVPLNETLPGLLCDQNDRE